MKSPTFTSAAAPPQLSFSQQVIKKGWIGKGMLILIAIVAVWRLAVAVIANPNIFIQQVVNGLQLGFVYALIALGYTMVYGIVRLINFAHGDVFMVGAFAGFFAISTLGLDFVPAVLLAMLVCMVLGV